MNVGVFIILCSASDFPACLKTTRNLQARQNQFCCAWKMISQVTKVQLQGAQFALMDALWKPDAHNFAHLARRFLP
jgi:hypothetical protein